MCLCWCFDTGLVVCPKLALNSWFSCLSILSGVTPGVHPVPASFNTLYDHRKRNYKAVAAFLNSTLSPRLDRTISPRPPSLSCLGEDGSTSSATETTFHHCLLAPASGWSAAEQGPFLVLLATKATWLCSLHPSDVPSILKSQTTLSLLASLTLPCFSGMCEKREACPRVHYNFPIHMWPGSSSATAMEGTARPLAAVHRTGAQGKSLAVLIGFLSFDRS